MDFILLFTIISILLAISSLKNRLTLSTFVVFFYFLMILFSLPTSLYFGHLDYNSGFISSGAIIFSILLCALLSPFLVINLNKVNYLRLPKPRVIKVAVYMSISLSLISIVYFSYICVLVFTYDNLVGIRHELVHDGHPFIKRNILNTISGVTATFFTIPVFLFYLLLLTNIKRSILIMLFISSLSYPAFVFAYFGRDGVIFWIIAHMSAYLMFKNSYPIKIRKTIKRYVVLFSLLGVGGFLFISFSRFGEGEAFISMMSYLGQPAINFIDIAMFDFENTYGSGSFNLIYSLFSDEDKYSYFLHQLGADIQKSWVFGTILKNLYVEFGFLGSLVLLLNISLLFIISFLLNSRVINISKLFVFFAYSQIVIQGVFYFRQYNDVGNFYIICLFLLAIIGMFISFENTFNLKENKS